MKRINPFAFYTFGQTLLPLSSVPEGQLVSEWRTRLVTAKSWLETTCNNPVLPLRICKNSSAIAVQAIDVLLEKPNDYQLSPHDVNWLAGAILEFQSVFREELNISDTYVVAQIANFSTTIMVEFGDSMFPEDIRKELPPDAIFDVKQGARCFAFDLSTAAGFHFLRALESVIRALYDELSNKAPRPTRAGMGIYIDELVKLNAHPELVATLKQIKDLHRNPINHPGEKLDMVEAQMLMGIMQSAVFSMVKIAKTKQIGDSLRKFTQP